MTQKETTPVSDKQTYHFLVQYSVEISGEPSKEVAEQLAHGAGECVTELLKQIGLEYGGVKAVVTNAPGGFQIKENFTNQQESKQ